MMNALDSKITELFSVAAYKNGWSNEETFANYMEIRHLIDRGINSRSSIISVLRIAGA